MSDKLIVFIINMRFEIAHAFKDIFHYPTEKEEHNAKSI